jgi:uncharacterized membrane protein YobD (UPF0266 family)
MMILVQISAYILFFTLILFIATRALWIVFFIFSYRFWEAILSKEVLHKYIHFKGDFDYYIFIIIIALITYFAVVIAANSLTSPILKYIFLVVMMFYTFQKYSFEDIFFFKDYLKAHGMWGLDYWTNQIKEVFVSSADDKKSVMRVIWDKTIHGLVRFWGYFAHLFH